MFLDPRFKDQYAVNKVKFNTNVANWIQEECEKNINPGDKGLRNLDIGVFVINIIF